MKNFAGPCCGNSASPHENLGSFRPAPVIQEQRHALYRPRVTLLGSHEPPDHDRASVYVHNTPDHTLA